MKFQDVFQCFVYNICFSITIYGGYLPLCRPLSKTVRFNVLKVIPAGSSGGGKKAFTAI